jgi:hypothetical protein
VKAWTPQNQGRVFEKEWAERFGSKPVKGSGSFWYCKMDVDDGVIVWSLKWTSKETFSVKPGLLYETIAAIRELGLRDATPGLAVAVGGRTPEIFTILLADDMIHALTMEAPYIVPTKDEARRQGAAIPALLRATA